MVTVLPFKALRYKSTENLQELICPPYDIISAEDKKALLEKSKYNFVRIELPDSSTSARRRFRNWLKNKVIIRDNQAALYIYQQEFFLPVPTGQKKKFKRTGFFALVELQQEEFIQHEKTTSENINNRLELLKELKVNASPIFALFKDSDKSVRRAIEKSMMQKKIEFKDTEDIIHRLWKVTDNKAISTITKKLSQKNLFIADGHHRYQASWSYSTQYNQSAKYILSYLCPIEDPGIIILPTHRVVRAYTDIEQKIQKYFSLTQWDGKSKPQIVCYYKGEFKVLNLIPRYLSTLIKLGKGEWKIPTVILQKFVLGDVPTENIFYTKNFQEAIKKADEISGFAFLVEVPKLDIILNVTKAGIVLPPKTTYFYPKVPAGLVIYEL